jgi:hypothetical protein
MWKELWEPLLFIAFLALAIFSMWIGSDIVWGFGTG